MVERMTADEIRRNYNEAKDKPQQITILANLNICSRADIKRILNGKTDELPPVDEKKSKRAYNGLEIRSPKSNDAIPKMKPHPKQRYRRLTADEKAEVLRLYESGWRQQDIADHFGCSKKAIEYTLKKFREEKKMIFAEDLDNAEREKLTEEVQNTAAVPVNKVQTYEFASEEDVGSIAGGLLEAVAELCASGCFVSVQPVDAKGVITVIVEKGDNYACLKRRMSKE